MPGASLGASPRASPSKSLHETVTCSRLAPQKCGIEDLKTEKLLKLAVNVKWAGSVKITVPPFALACAAAHHNFAVGSGGINE